MKTSILLFILFIPLSLPAQNNVKIIYPGTHFLYQTNDTLYCLPKQKLEILMEREKINTELIATFENRLAVCDSALRLKCKETENWYNKLLETDTHLKEAEITNVRQEHRYKFKNKIWFGAGVVLGWLVFAVL